MLIAAGVLISYEALRGLPGAAPAPAAVPADGPASGAASGQVPGSPAGPELAGRRS